MAQQSIEGHGLPTDCWPNVCLSEEVYQIPASLDTHRNYFEINIKHRDIKKDPWAWALAQGNQEGGCGLKKSHFTNGLSS